MGCFTWKKKNNNNNNNTNTSIDNKEMEMEKWAKVIWTSGELREFAVPVTVEHVLRSEQSVFICNSDNLYFDQPIPALHAHDQLRADGIYFALPDSTKHIPLSASDMAAMALKATAAIEAATLRRSSSRRRTQKKKKKQSRISPMVVGLGNGNGSDPLVALSPDYDYQLTVNNNKSPSSSSSSIKITKTSKLQRMSSRSRRSNMALRSFKLRLSTIYESA